MIDVLIALGPALAVPLLRPNRAPTMGTAALALGAMALSFGVLVGLGYVAWHRKEREYGQLLIAIRKGAIEVTE